MQLSCSVAGICPPIVCACIAQSCGDWGPMAYAIMGGLAGATALTLIFLPVLYVIWHRIKRPQPDSIQKIDLPHTAIAQPLT